MMVLTIATIPYAYVASAGPSFPRTAWASNPVGGGAIRAGPAVTTPFKSVSIANGSRKSQSAMSKSSGGPSARLVIATLAISPHQGPSMRILIPVLMHKSRTSRARLSPPINAGLMQMDAAILFSDWIRQQD